MSLPHSSVFSSSFLFNVISCEMKKYYFINKDAFYVIETAGFGIWAVRLHVHVSANDIRTRGDGVLVHTAVQIRVPWFGAATLLILRRARDHTPKNWLFAIKLLLFFFFKEKITVFISSSLFFLFFSKNFLCVFFKTAII